MDDKISMMLAEDLVRRKGTYFVVEPIEIGLDKVVSGHYKESTAVEKASGEKDLVVWEQVGEWEDCEPIKVDFKLLESDG